MAVGEIIKPKGNAKKTRVVKRSRSNNTFRKFFFSSLFIVSMASGLVALNNIANRSDKEKIQKEDAEKAKEEESRVKRMNGGEYGETPSELRRLNKDLLKAATKDDDEKVAHLLEIGADVNTRTGFSSTPLLLASRNWWMGDETVKVLIENGADVNAKNSLGLTPLMVASMHGHISAVKVLLEHGADVDAVDNRGETALDKAIRFEFEKTVALIENHKKTKKKNLLSF